ncbi:MAG TPA: 5'-3' exonuclease H3TH domain-containing protein, partial [Burkholderiales bacterium]|nr:5'-3' exonuclease H3TH domain-containing protein [Burkholderiales bacterium]
MKTLLLVDGSSYLYRAFHAMPDLRSKRGEPTGAIYGVLNMLRRLHKDYPSALSACVFDAKGKTFRDDVYAEYKANRPPMPDDLSHQIAPLHEAIAAMGWPLLIVDGVEADDVIGTLARDAERAGMHVVISTGDKDITQLVSPQITLVNTMTNESLDETGVEQKFGVKPERIVDYLTLIGDTVDNVPGVAKVGPKTAVKWLMQYGTLDNVVAHAGEIGGVVGDNLRKALDWLPTARGLLTIKCDVSLPVKLDDLGLQPQQLQKLDTLFENFDFKSWRKELQGVSAQNIEDAVAPALANVVVVTAPQPPMEKHYETVATDTQLDTWLEKIRGAKLTAVDTETTSLDPFKARLVGISLCAEAGHAAYIPVGHRYPGAGDQLALDHVLAKLKPWLEDTNALKLGQHLKYDTHVFANHGVALRGAAHDTLLQSYVLESHKPHDMDDLAERHLSIKTITYDDVTGKGAGRIGFEQVSTERATEYAAEDADITLRLHEVLYPQVAADEKLLHIYRDIELPVMQVLQVME